MTSPFVGEIKMFGCNFAPRNYAFCNGQILSIAQNTALFSLLGTYYGGNGTTNFALPDLRGRSPLNQLNGPGLTPRTIGERGGSETVTLLQTEMPAHTHMVEARSSPADRANATNASPAVSKELAYVTSAAASTPMSPLGTTTVGGSQPHNNMQPFLAINFCIALFGVFPSRS
jgi:microcystin-dependent protein